jgi:hypothetical protein
MAKTNLKTIEEAPIMTENKEPVGEKTVETPAQRGLPKVVVKPTDEQLTELAKLTSTSAKIRYLAGTGYSSKDNLYSGIANYLGVRTQQVRNVLVQPLKKV